MPVGVLFDVFTVIAIVVLVCLSRVLECFSLVFEKKEEYQVG